MNKLHEKIKKKMEEKNITQHELACAAGVSEAFMCNMLKGYKKPSLDVAKRIADYLGVTVDELID